MPVGPLTHTRSVIIAVAVHIVVFALFVVGYQMKPKPSQAVVDPVNIVKAEVIDGAAIELEKRKKREGYNQAQYRETSFAFFAFFADIPISITRPIWAKTLFS